MDIFQEWVEKDLIILNQRISLDHKHCHFNLSYGVRKALRNLRANEDLLIKMLDKGRAVVVMDSGLYLKYNLDLLADTEVYIPLNRDPTIEFQGRLKSLLNEAVSSEVLTSNMADKIYIPHLVTPIFHSLPKMHKQVFPPPLRSFVAGIGSMSENLAAWVDNLLQPQVFQIPGFLKTSIYPHLNKFLGLLPIVG